MSTVMNTAKNWNLKIGTLSLIIIIVYYIIVRRTIIQSDRKMYVSDGV